MQFPTLRGPVGASVLAGVAGAGAVDLALTAAHGGGSGAIVLAVGLYGTAAVLAGVVADLIFQAVDGARPASWQSLRDEPEHDRAAAAGILATLLGALVMAAVAAAGQQLLISKMQSQKLATIAAAGMVLIGALPGAVMALAALPLLRRIAHALPRPRAVSATGFLLIGLALAGALAFVGALSRADWRVLDLGPLYALGLAVVFAAGHGAFWFASWTGRRLRAALPPQAGPLILVGLAVVSAIGLVMGAGVPEGSPAYAAIDEHALGMRALLGVARRATDRDGDGFSAKFGGGDCDDTRADVHPGAEDIPGDGIDQNCEGGDAQPVAAAPAAANHPAPETPPARVEARAGAFTGNILIVTIDAFRGDRLGVAGYGRPAGHSLTPTLDALARRGAYFRRVWSQAPNTPRSFPAILTGRYPSDIAWDKPTVNYPNLLPTNHTFFEGLRAVGLDPVGIFSHFYFTADRGINRGFVEWSDDGALSIAESNKDSASPRIVPRVIARLKQAAAKKERFVIWTHLFEPHSSYMQHKEFPTSLSGVPGLMEKYDYEIAFTDLWVKKLMDTLRETGLDENTAVVVMADHGEAWGEHKAYFHGTDLYDEQTRVPLIIAIPGRKPRVIDQDVELVDVAPTLLDLTGAPVPPSIRGRSLLPAIDGDPLPPAPIF
ncbi:MAG TPA: sulfatase-like hydrolase/transferase, partial [Polyangia bacterium]|nr:sulfatase-like hydrolase/transferase [Polyangia bacterium]